MYVRMRFLEKDKFWHFRRPVPSVGLRGPWVVMKSDEDSITPSLSESIVIRSIGWTALGIIIDFIIILLFLSICFGCASKKQAQLDTASSQVQVSQVDGVHSDWCEEITIAASDPAMIMPILPTLNHANTKQAAQHDTQMPAAISIVRRSAASGARSVMAEHKEISLSQHKVSNCDSLGWLAVMVIVTIGLGLLLRRLRA